MGIRYASREDVKAAMDFKDSAADNTRIDRAIEAASRSVEALCHRKFYPQTATRYFDWPNQNRPRTWRLWLDADELISVTTLTSGGVTISSSDYFLEPVNVGPPYTRIEIDLASSAAFESGDTHQRAVAVTGVFGANDTWDTATTLDGAVSSSSATSMTISSAALVGVGDTLKLGSEIVVVTEKALADTGQTVSTDALTAKAGNTSVVVSGGTWTAGEVIWVESEAMLVTAVAGTTLTVKRAWDGTVLAAHATSTAVYAPRSLTVTRGALGTTASTHLDGATVTKLAVPALVHALTVAEAQTTLMNQGAGYARTIGSGDNERESRGVALVELRKQVRALHGRKARMRTV